jgi:hypothetical protein
VFGAETSSLDAVSAALHGETAEVAAGRNGRNKPVFFRRIVKMDRHDQELLDKQMRRLSPPRNDGVIVVLLATIFLVGMTLGGVLSDQETEPAQIASIE